MRIGRVGWDIDQAAEQEPGLAERGDPFLEGAVVEGDFELWSLGAERLGERSRRKVVMDLAAGDESVGVVQGQEQTATGLRASAIVARTPARSWQSSSIMFAVARSKAPWWEGSPAARSAWMNSICFG